MVMYDYGNSDMGLLLLANRGSSLGSVVSWYRSGAGGVNAGAAWPIVGDFNGDGKTDVLMMYDYGNSWTKFLLFSNRKWLLQFQRDLGFRYRKLDLGPECPPHR